MILGVADPVEIIPGKLYWATLAVPPVPDNSRFCFSIDDEFVYETFFYDFGPLNLAHTVRYCDYLLNCLEKHSVVVHYTSDHPHKRANAAYLMCAYQVIILHRAAEDACRCFNGVNQFTPFRDASCGPCAYECTILDCMQGLQYAIKFRWFEWATFNLASYEYYEKVENGDMTWILPNKFLAFGSPSEHSLDAEGYVYCTPADYVPLFKSAGIGMVIRLNKKTYSRQQFVKNGIKHVDLYYLDGSCPSPEIISKFFDVAENEPRPIAIHCKAGLGRTGTLIGLYSMKHYGIPARAFLGWNRICRPGSILGPQQQFLSAMQDSMFEAGALLRMGSLTNLRPSSALSDAQRKVYECNHDRGQGSRLRSARRLSIVRRDTPKNATTPVLLAAAESQNTLVSI
eukprot:GEMP01013383.1.p1 GENE.GEMP01013383.1~~GEMP01013383.1.p1  ORF type:complete len:399 (+),score=78.49 GEMP01013383.1:196-1392(+)